jgi:2,5-furandicarboxylate decarboxylase 1
MEDLRSFISKLEKNGELLRIHKQVDVRHVSSLVDQAQKAVFFEDPRGFAFPIVSGIVGSRKRIALALDCPDREIGKKFSQAISNVIPPKVVKTGPCKEVIRKGKDVDLTELPIPLLHSKDGGPYISGGVVCSQDPEYGPNAGMYRLMFRTKNETGIDLASPSDMRRYYERAFQKGKSLEVGIALGVHPFETLSAGYKAPIGMNEFAVAGGLHGGPVEMVRCETNDVLVPAHAEIVLEGEILPIGWTEDEGRFGENTQIEGDVKWNPVVRIHAITHRKDAVFYALHMRIHAITHRKDAVFYALHMPWENSWPNGPALEAAAWRALKEASVDTMAVRATPGACCSFEIVASVRKRAGEGKNALLALLSVGLVKLAIVTDDDIDIFNPDELDWALAFRVQADQDVLVIPGARGKHLDPSVKSWTLPKHVMPTSAKLGIDATIPEGVSRSRYERLEYTFKNVRLADYL